MTAEEKREQILKRALPALFITIIYFIFISNIMGDQAAKAQDDYTALMRKGISPASLPGVYKQQEQARQQLTSLKAEQAEYLKTIKGMVGYLAGDADVTEATTLLANILAKHNLRVAREVSEPFDSKNLPPSLREVKGLLQESIKAGETFNVQHVWLHGRFQDMHAALVEINAVKLAAIPVLFTMSVPENAQVGVLDWELVLWM
ncbi:MAG: hypothetical protein P1P78_04265 [Methyloprofundus sp.]|nr:hypothetical protein [Methyloprofundus sp.]